VERSIPWYLWSPSPYPNNHGILLAHMEFYSGNVLRPSPRMRGILWQNRDAQQHLRLVTVLDASQLSLSPQCENHRFLTSNRNIIGLTIAPVFFTAAMYLTLSRVIRHYGVHNSFLSPGWYTGIFLTADIISLIGQSVGGGIADMSTTKSGSNTGVHIMVGGLAFQIVSMTFFSILVASFFLRVRKDLARQRATNWAAGKVDPPTTHVHGYSTFVWSISNLPHQAMSHLLMY
jgi:hypothetical protein